MTTFRLPTFKDDPDHKYNIQLDGQTIILEFHYNERADRWSIHLFDIENVAIRHGVRLAAGAFDLLRRVALATKPPGRLFIIDTTGLDTEPDSETFGAEVQLRYTEEADL
jgi:hypothetical protein